MTNHDQEPTIKIKEVIATHIALPEFLREETVKGLLPDQIVFVYPSFLCLDQKTGGIYIDTSRPLDTDNFSLSSFIKDKESKIAIMQAMGTDGTMRYVVDATGLKPGQINVESSLFYENGIEEYPEAVAKYVAPAVIVFKSLDEELEFHGDPEYFDAARLVLEAFDEAIVKNNSDERRVASNLAHVAEIAEDYSI
jgi:hypothetical protein